MALVYLPEFEVTIGSHYFTITNIRAHVISDLRNFTRQYIVTGLGRGPDVPEHHYYSRINDGAEWRFHIGQYSTFVKYMQNRGYKRKSYIENLRPLYEATGVKLPLQKWVTPRDYQVGAIDFVSEPNTIVPSIWLENIHAGAAEDTDLHSRLISAPTGTGKTVMASVGLHNIAKRFAVVVLPKYMDKWVNDLTNIFKLSKKEIGYIGSIKGSSSSDVLKGLISLKDTPKDIPKALVISLTTYRLFINAYENSPEQCRLEYGLVPDEFFEALGVGVLLTDETHEHIHSVFKLLSFTHIPRVIALSGTMLSDDRLVEAMQKTMFPKGVRYEEIEMEKYIEVYAVSYIFDNLRASKIRTTNYGSSMYSHNEYENSIMRNSGVLKNYLKLIDEQLQDFYLNRRKEGQKAAVYLSTIKMCTVVTEYLKRKYPALDVRRYCEDDPYENAIDADIRVTTHLSAGTAIDIPGLITVIQTVSVRSSVANQQNLGRLRKIEGTDVKYVYLFCELIKKQVDYHFNRVELFRPRVASITDLRAKTIL